MSFNTRQLNVINAKDKNILCLAAASSGKTSTVIGRIRRLLDEGADPHSIVCFSFTNQAAQEVKLRIGEEGEFMQISTIHSYANFICALGGIDTAKDIADEKFDRIIEKALTVDWSLYPPVEFLFVDEFQDTDPLQYSFLERIPANNRFYCGDERQFIFGFKGATDRFIRELATDDNFAKYYLVENYRNPPNILRFANNFLKNMEKISPTAIPTKEKNGFLDNNCTFDDIIDEIGWDKDWGNWAVICRTNAEVDEAKRRLNENYIPTVSIRRGDMDYAELKNMINRKAVKVMTIHTCKGLEFDKIIAVGCKTFNVDERRIAYVAATRAREALYWCPPIKPPADLEDGGEATDKSNEKKKKKKSYSSEIFNKTKTIIF